LYCPALTAGLTTDLKTLSIFHQYYISLFV